MQRPLRSFALLLSGVLAACGTSNPVCGDNITEGTEACDDGNLQDDDACTHLCTEPQCGDGIVSPGEACDDGNRNDQDACTSACEIARCGDGIQRMDKSRDEQGYEACDDPSPERCTDACLRPQVQWRRVLMGGSDAGATTCAFEQNGSLRCWGNNRYGVLGVPLGEDRLEPGPIFEESPLGLAIGGGHVCEWHADGSGACWGLATAGQTGPSSSEPCSRSARETCRLSRGEIGLADIESIGAGLTHSCAYHSGQLSCWGSNLHGQVADPQRREALNQPVPLEGMTDLEGYALGGFHSCAIVTGGAVQCWGRNAEGQLGNGSDQDAFLPVPVRDLSHVSQLALGERHSCAVDGSGQVFCWGYNGYGQLGQGEIPSPRRCRLGQSSRNHCHRWPVPVSDLAPVQNIVAGARHTCALQRDGRVWCWGDNRRGQVGDGTTEGELCIPPDGVTLGCRAGPVPVMGLPVITSLAAGHEATCSLDDLGIIRCWGRNTWGQLGLGDREDRLSPTPLETY